MAYSRLYAARIAAGNCLTCDAPRTGPASTTVRCSACNAEHKRRRRERRREIHTTESPDEARDRIAREHVGKSQDYEALKARGVCTQCRKPRLPEDIRRGVLRCARCRAKARAYAETRRRARYEKSMWRGLRDGKPLPLGRNVKVGIVRQIAAQIDTGALFAIRTLQKKDKERRQALTPGVPVEFAFQLSRIVREAVSSWADRPSCPTRLPGYRRMIETRIGFGADAKTLAAIERHAPARGGNISATVCDMLVAVANRPEFIARPGATRRYAKGFEPDPWDAP